MLKVFSIKYGKAVWLCGRCFYHPLTKLSDKILLRGCIYVWWHPRRPIKPLGGSQNMLKWFGFSVFSHNMWYIWSPCDVTKCSVISLQLPCFCPPPILLQPTKIPFFFLSAIESKMLLEQAANTGLNELLPDFCGIVLWWNPGHNKWNLWKHSNYCVQPQWAFEILLGPANVPLKPPLGTPLAIDKGRLCSPAAWRVTCLLSARWGPTRRFSSPAFSGLIHNRFSSPSPPPAQLHYSLIYSSSDLLTHPFFPPFFSNPTGPPSPRGAVVLKTNTPPRPFSPSASLPIPSIPSSFFLVFADR